MASFLAYLAILFLDTGVTRVVTYDGARWGMFTVDYGYALVWNDPNDALVTHARTLALYGPDGHKLYVTSLNTADGVEVYPLAAAIDKDGTVAVSFNSAGKARAADGITFLNATGKAGNLISTNPFVAGYLCFAEDGSVWTAGLEDQHPATDFMTIRKFSKGGGQSGAYLPFSEVSLGYESTYTPLFPRSTGGWGIAAAHDRIGVVAQGRTSRWLEFDFAGKLLGHWDMPPYLRIGAFTSSGILYGQSRDTSGPPALMVLDKTTGEWVKTGGTLDGHLVGAEGEDLVFRLDTVPGNTFVWVRMRAQWAATAHQN